MKAHDKISGQLAGIPTVYVAADAADRSSWVKMFGGRNVVCDGMHTALHRLLLRDFVDWAPASVSIGYGGEYSQPADPNTTPPAPTGARVAPASTDTYVRKAILDAPILQAEDPGVVGAKRAKYTAIVAPDALTTGATDRPFIDELGLVAANGTLLAHYVTPADGSGNTTKFSKTSLEWLIIEWEIDYVGS